MSTFIFKLCIAAAIMHSWLWLWPKCKNARMLRFCCTLKNPQIIKITLASNTAACFVIRQRFCCVILHNLLVCVFGPCILDSLLPPFHPMTEQCTRHLICVLEWTACQYCFKHFIILLALFVFLTLLSKLFLLFLICPILVILFCFVTIHSVQFACIAQGWQITESHSYHYYPWCLHICLKWFALRKSALWEGAGTFKSVTTSQFAVLDTKGTLYPELAVV